MTNGKGDRNRTADHKAFRDGWDSTFLSGGVIGPTEKRVLMVDCRPVTKREQAKLDKAMADYRKKWNLDKPL